MIYMPSSIHITQYSILSLRPRIRSVHGRSMLTVGQIPRSMEDQLGSFFQQVKFNFIHRIGRLMVIIMHAVEEENYWDIVLGKVRMVRTVVEPVWIILGIITIIQDQVGIGNVVVVVDHLQMRRKHLRSDHIHIILVFGILILIIDPANHIDIDIVYGVFKRKYRVVGVILRTQ